MCLPCKQNKWVQFLQRAPKVKEEMEYKIPVNKFNIYKSILTLINFKLGLSDMEIDMIATIFKYNFNKIDGEARDILRKALDKDQYSINNYIKRLKVKGVFIENDKKVYLNPNLKVNIDNIVESKEINFKFVTDN